MRSGVWTRVFPFLFFKNRKLPKPCDGWYMQRILMDELVAVLNLVLSNKGLSILWASNVLFDKLLNKKNSCKRLKTERLSVEESRLWAGLVVHGHVLKHGLEFVVAMETELMIIKILSLYQTKS